MQDKDVFFFHQNSIEFASMQDSYGQEKRWQVGKFQIDWKTHKSGKCVELIILKWFVDYYKSLKLCFSYETMKIILKDKTINQIF